MDNPYDVTTTDSFYVGNEYLRYDLISRITTSRQSFAIIGGRRCGKTSTLYQLRKDLARVEDDESIYLTLYIGPGSFDRASPASRYSSAGLWRRIYGLLMEHVSVTDADPIKEGSPYASFLGALGHAGETLCSHYNSRNWVAIVMIDEIDAIKEGLPSETMFFANLRELLSASPYVSRFRVVVTGMNDLSGLTDFGSPLRNILAIKELGIIDDKSVEELVRSGFVDGLSDDARSCLKESTGGHPYLLQGVLHELWHDWNTRRETIERCHVLAAVRAFESDYRQTFQGWRAALGQPACDVFGFLSANGGNASRRQLKDALGYDLGMIDDALSRLATHGVVEAGDEQELRIVGSMFRTWFERYVAKPRVTSVLEEAYAILDKLELDQDKKEAIQQELSGALKNMEREIPPKGAVAAAVRNGCKLIRDISGTAEGVEKIVTAIEKALPYLPMGVKVVGGFVTTL